MVSAGLPSGGPEPCCPTHRGTCRKDVPSEPCIPSWSLLLFLLMEDFHPVPLSNTGEKGQDKRKENNSYDFKK